jgi:anti-sigma B factor antagonist
MLTAEGIAAVGPERDGHQDLTSGVAYAIRQEVPVPRPTALTSSTQTSRHGAPPPFDCSWEAGGFGAAWVRVAGELDLATAPQLRQTLAEARVDARLIVLDAREITFIDSAGVHVILDAARDARREGRRLMLVRGSPEVDHVLALTGASAHISTFDLDPTEPAATLHLTRTHAAA